MPETLVIVPTYNEVDNLERTIGRLRQTVPHAKVRIIDDQSPDGTGALADRLAAADAHISVHHRHERGYGDAVRAGFGFAIESGATQVAVIDADGSFDIDLLPELLAAIAAGNDLAIASRWVPGGDVRNMAGRRRILSQAGNAYARGLLGTDVRDLTSAFRAYSVRILKQLPLKKIKSDAYAFQIELAVRVAQAGGRIVELPVEFSERALGTSKMRVADLVHTLHRVTNWGVRGIRARPKRDQDAGQQ